MEGLRYAKKVGPLGMNILDYLTSGEYEADYRVAQEAEKSCLRTFGTTRIRTKSNPPEYAKSALCHSCLL